MKYKLENKLEVYVLCVVLYCSIYKVFRVGFEIFNHMLKGSLVERNYNSFSI